MFHPWFPGDQLRGEPPRIATQFSRDFLTGEFPDDRAQLWQRVEGEAIVDAPDVAVAVEQAMTAFAVGVVDDHVERGHGAKVGSPGGHPREVMLADLGPDKLLHRARAHRTPGAIDRPR